MDDQDKKETGGWWGKFRRDPFLVVMYLPMIVVPILWKQNNDANVATIKFLHDNYQSIIATKNQRITYLEDRNDRKDATIDSLYKLAGRQEVINTLKPRK